jgi:hypothetical protein
VRIGILVKRDAGGRLGTKLVSLGNDVRMGPRTAPNPKAAAVGAIQTRNFNFRIAR